MREIALDTETTGLYTKDNDRITEIGCVEIIDKKLTGNSFHVYVNPQRELSIASQEISGLSYEFLKRHQTFDNIVQDFLDFIGNDRLVIHNAPFDIGFLNFELNRMGKGRLNNEVIDTLVMAKHRFPGSPSTLDALCRRFSVDKSKRVKHGALIDAELLAEVYIMMSVVVTQRDIFSSQSSDGESDNNEVFDEYDHSNYISPRYFETNKVDYEQHLNFMKKIQDSIWSLC